MTTTKESSTMAEYLQELQIFAQELQSHSSPTLQLPEDLVAYKGIGNVSYDYIIDAGTWASTEALKTLSEVIKVEKQVGDVLVSLLGEATWIACGTETPLHYIPALGRVAIRSFLQESMADFAERHDLAEPMDRLDVGMSTLLRDVISCSENPNQAELLVLARMLPRNENEDEDEESDDDDDDDEDDDDDDFPDWDDRGAKIKEYLDNRRASLFNMRAAVCGGIDLLILKKLEDQNEAEDEDEDEEEPEKKTASKPER